MYRVSLCSLFAQNVAIFEMTFKRIIFYSHLNLNFKSFFFKSINFDT